jgi:hypothetical protein
MIARLAAGLQAASLFILEKIDELRNRGFFNAEPIYARMTRKPRRLNTLCCSTTRTTNLRLDLY